MPIKSKAQRGYLHAAAARGDISKKVVAKLEKETPKGAKLPAQVAKKKAKKKKKAVKKKG